MWIERVMPVFLFAFAFSFFNTPLFAIVLKKFNIMDLPNPGKMHKRAVPRGCGISILISFVLSSIFAFRFFFSAPHFDLIPFIVLILAAALVALWGFLDDAISLSPGLKLVGQMTASVMIILAGIRIGLLPAIFAVPISIFWLIGITNAFNLLDGMDGLAGSTAFVGALFFSYLFYLSGSDFPFYLSIALCGSILGFLPFNAPPAKVFMGDAGSLFLGFSLGVLAILATSNSANYFQLFVPVLILSVPVFDTFLSVARRIYKGRSVFGADCEHFYNYLSLKKRMSTPSVVVLTVVLAGLFGASGLIVYRFF